ISTHGRQHDRCRRRNRSTARDAFENRRCLRRRSGQLGRGHDCGTRADHDCISCARRRHDRDRALPAAHQHHSRLATTNLDSTPVGMTKKMRERTYTIRRAFTLIELLVVISIIVILAGLILSTVGYVQKKGARSRAEAEIAAISAALESYKADNGIYPRDTTN